MKCKYVIDFYDKDCDKKLNLDEFTSFLLPLNDSILRQEVVNREIYPMGNNDNLPFDVENLVLQLLNREIKANDIIEKERHKLLNMYEYKVQSAFKLIDLKHSRYITFKMLDRFYKSLNIEVKKEDIIAFMQRADRDLDCNISFEEFAYILSPIDKSVKLKPAYMTPTKAFQEGIIDKSDNEESTSINKLCVKSKESGFSDIKEISMGKYSLYELMQKHLGVEKEIENIKKDLMNIRNITINKIWKIFSPTGKKYINSIEFFLVLENLGLNPNKEAAYFLFSRFDKDIDGKLKELDIMQLVMPMNYEDNEAKFLSSISKEYINKLKELLKIYLQNEMENDYYNNYIDSSSLIKYFEEFDMDKRYIFNSENVICNLYYS